jgi:hypothetical protein
LKSSEISSSSLILQQDQPLVKETTQQEWIQQEYQLLVHHLETIEKAIEVKYSLQALKQNGFPDLSSFFPQSVVEIDIQLFNLNQTLPKHLLTTTSSSNPLSPGREVPSHERIALWILEKRDSINSNTLASYLLQVNNQLILYSIASKICSLEIGQHFIDGLKYYLPVCGFWALTVPSHPQFKEDLIQYILEIYVKAHLTNSLNPLLSNTMDHFNALIEIGKATIELCQSLQEQNKPQTTMMSEFYQKVKIALRKTDGLTLSTKNINSLFVSASSSLITDIHPISYPANSPLMASRDFNSPSTPLAKPPSQSYLFPSVRKIGNLSVGVTVTDSFQKEYEVYLCWNALYFFELPVTIPSGYLSNKSPVPPISPNLSPRKKLLAVIPLKNLRIEKSINHDELQLMELFNITGEKVPWIIYEECNYFATKDSGNSFHYQFDAPKGMELYNQLMLKVSSKHTTHVFEEWLDALEECSWLTQMNS